VSDHPHKLGEVLRGAREAKGADLSRAERETKIRARYLSALERGEYRELPGPVYTKGFLRNYGLYLGLDPEYLVDLYRLEATGVGADHPAPGAPPRPRRRRRTRTFVVTREAVVAAILTIVVGALIAWLTYEFVNFAGIPDLRITQPPGDVAAYSRTQIAISGVTAPDARISVDGLGENREVTADHQGHFSFVAVLRPGSNVVELTATDPKTKRDSVTQRRTINVVTAEPTAPAAALDKPAANTTVPSPVAISGTAPDGTTLTVSAALVSATKPSFTVVDVNGAAVSLKPKTPLPSPTQVKISGGAFAGSMELAPGTWNLTVAGAAGAAPVTRRVTVQAPAGLKGKLNVTSAESYLEIDEDGRPKAGVSGGISQPHDSVALSAKAELRIRCGNAGSVELSINGVAIGLMGAPDEVVEWRITRSP
jgi:cytoskeletal protein RodZ